MVRTAGLEPALSQEKQILSLLRLPVSPRPQASKSAIVNGTTGGAMPVP